MHLGKINIVKENFQMLCKCISDFFFLNLTQLCLFSDHT